MTQHVSLGHRIQLNNIIIILYNKLRHMDNVIWEETEIELRSNNMKKEDGFILSLSQNFSFDPRKMAENLPQGSLVESYIGPGAPVKTVSYKAPILPSPGTHQP
jgi:hypothetical protein